MGFKRKNRDSDDKSGELKNGAASRDADFSTMDADAGAGEVNAVGDGEDGVVTAASREAELTEEIEKLKAESADYRDKYLRALADHENAQRHARRERSDLLKYQGEQILVEILEVVDTMERALEFTDSDPAKFREGVRLIHKQFIDALGKFDVRPESALGTQFDPNTQRAIGKARADGKTPGTVIAELKKPYRYKDKLLRFGEVIVADVEQEATNDSEAAEGNGSEGGSESSELKS